MMQQDDTAILLYYAAAISSCIDLELQKELSSDSDKAIPMPRYFPTPDATH